MARYNEILVGRFNRALQKLLGMKGEVPAPQVASEIMPIFPLPLGVEFRYLEGWFIYSNQVPIAAVAAQNSGFRLRNPTGSNVVAVIEKVTVSSSVASDVVMRMSSAIGVPNTDLGNVANGAPYDLRSLGSSVCIPSTNAPSTAFGNAPYRWSVVPSPPGLELIQTENQEIPVIPGTCIQFETVSVNTIFDVAMRWRERFLEESERT